MNCPHCKQLVAAEMVHDGRPEFVRNENGEIIDARHTLSLYCDFCGAIEVLFNWRGIESIVGPSADRRFTQRVLNKLPGRIRSRRAGCTLLPAEVAT